LTVARNGSVALGSGFVRVDPDGSDRVAARTIALVGRADTARGHWIGLDVED
jgi:hypothetical protein